MVSKTQRLLVIFALVASFGLLSDARAEDYRPLALTPDKTVTFEADPRSSLWPEGSIELLFSVPSVKSNGTLAQYGDAVTGIDWRISIEASGTLVRIEFPGAGLNKTFAADLRDRAVHQLVVSIRSNRADVLFDGKVVDGFATELPLPTPTGKKLTLGSAQTTANVDALRLWSLGLTTDDAKWSRSFKGRTDGSRAISKSLLAYSVFSEFQQTLRFVAAPVEFTAVQGGVGGKPFFASAVADRALKGIALAMAGSRVEAIQIETTAPEGMSNATPEPTLSAAAKSARAAAADALYKQRSTGSSDSARVVALVKEARRACLPESLLKSAGPRATDVLALDAPSGQDIRGVVAVHDGRFIQYVRFAVGAPGGQVTMWPDTPATFRGLVVSAWIPKYARCAGIVGRVDDTGRLVAIGLAHVDEPRSELEQLMVENSFGRFVLRRDPPPMKLPHGSATPWELRRSAAADAADPSGLRRRMQPAMSTVPHGNYSTPPIFVCNWLPRPAGRGVLVVQRDNGHSITEERFVQRNDAIWPIADANGNAVEGAGRIILASDRLLLSGTNFPEHDLELIRPQPYDDPTPDKLAWGGTFSVNERPTLALANFVGYNIFRMNPKNIQSSVVAGAHIFDYPSEDSSAYQSGVSPILLPYGLFFRSDDVGTEHARTDTFASESEYASSWNINVGVDVGIPEVASFSENVSYTSSSSWSSNSEATRESVRTTETRYGMVVDRARMKLDSDFQARVRDLSDARLLYGPVPDQVDELMFRFGTHFPFAVTYGGMAWAEGDHEKSGSSSSSSTSMQAEVKASGILEGFSGGISVGGGLSNSNTQSTWNAVSITDFGTYGGNLSKGQGWSMAKGEELPLLLDLRPLAQIMGPVFFSELPNWLSLRHDLEARLSDWARRPRSTRDERWPKRSAEQWDGRAVSADAAQAESGFGWTSDISPRPSPNDPNACAMVVGAPGNGGTVPGSAYVAIKELDRAIQFVPLRPVQAPAGAVPKRFGRAVSISGDVIAIGAEGEVQMFRFNPTSSSWEFSERIRPTAGPSSGFGFAVDVDGTTCVIGDPDTASVHVYESAIGAGWRHTARIHDTNMTAVDRFGYAVSVREPVLAIGAPIAMNDSGRCSGRVHLYAREAQGRDGWAKVRTIQPRGESDAGHEHTPATAAFGWSVAMNKDTLVVGAPGTAFVNDPERVLKCESTCGRAFVLKLTPQNWTGSQLRELAVPWGKTNPTIKGSDGFGVSVSSFADRVLIGCSSPVGKEAGDATVLGGHLFQLAPWGGNDFVNISTYFHGGVPQNANVRIGPFGAIGVGPGVFSAGQLVPESGGKSSIALYQLQ